MKTGGGTRSVLGRFHCTIKHYRRCLFCSIQDLVGLYGFERHRISDGVSRPLTSMSAWTEQVAADTASVCATC